LYAAAGITYQGNDADGRIMNELQRINPLWHRQRWPGMNAKLIAHYPTPDDIQRILQTPDFPHWGGGPDSDHYFGALESVHNYMHNFSGGLNPNYIIGQNPELYNEPQFGHMVESRVTAFDPIFWAHHANVDRLYAQWQEMHPGVNPQVLNSPLAPFEMAVSDTLSIQNLGYEYMQDAYHFPTDSTQGFVRFGSEQVAIPLRVLHNHRRAEIRLHKVQVAQRGANIRVFINQPEANADTPVERNEHYVGSFTTFVGFCYGGPGHCDVPPSTQRPFDHRMRHHKMPGNLRFEITEAVQKLLRQHKSKSASLPLSVQLVVTDLHGHTREDLLKMDGVSIAFIH
jgi:tyrosinase